MYISKFQTVQILVTKYILILIIQLLKTLSSEMLFFEILILKYLFQVIWNWYEFDLVFGIKLE